MYPITEQAVDLLTKIRIKMESAWGPEAVDQPANSTAKNASAGDGGADNPTDVNDAMNMYLTNVVDRLMAEFEMSEDDAIEFVFSMSDELAEEGDLPPMPEDEAADQEVSIWLGKANSLGFTGYVLGRARSEA
jgi:hypothetical protein